MGLHPPVRPRRVVPTGFHLDYTTVLDIVALVVFAGSYALHRNRARLGGGSGYATDPVCAMQVEIAHAPATATRDGPTYRFCSHHCRDRFTTDPDRYRPVADAPTPEPARQHP